MFKRKKVQKGNQMSYFFGGTAIGMAAGLLAGKLFSSTLAENTENLESETLQCRNISKYSQDDNIHHPYFHRNVHNSHARSKSASRYEDKNYTGQPFTIPLNKYEDDLKNNINNPNLDQKYDKDMHKAFCDSQKATFHNTSMEDNAKLNVFLENSEEEKRNNYFELEEMKQQKLSCISQYENNKSIKDNNLLRATNEKSTNDFDEEKPFKRTRVHESIELTETFGTMSINFCEGNSDYKNLQNVGSSIVNSNIADNTSNMATYNDTRCFNEEKEDNLNFTYVEEFYKNDLISSTKWNNLEDM